MNKRKRHLGAGWLFCALLFLFSSGWAQDSGCIMGADTEVRLQSDVETELSGDLIVQPFGKLDVSLSTAKIRVGRNFTVNGSFLPGASTLLFYGDQNSQISISSADKTSTIVLDKSIPSSVLQIIGTLGISETLSVLAGKLVLGDSSKLMIDAGKSINVSGTLETSYTSVKPQVVAGVSASGSPVNMIFAPGSTASINGLSLTGVAVFLPHDAVIDADANPSNGEDRILSQISFDNVVSGAFSAIPVAYLSVTSFPATGSAAINIHGSEFHNSALASGIFNVSTPSGANPSALLVDAGWVNTGALSGSLFENDHGVGTDESSSSTIRWFTAVSGLSPVTGASTNNPSQLLVWSALQGAVKYNAQYSTDGFTWISIGQTTSNSISLPNLPDGTYFWRVRGIDAFGNMTAWSASNTIVVDTVPPTVSPAPLSPANLAGFTTSFPIFSWSSVAGATYDIQVSNNSSFAAPLVYEATGLTSPQLSIPFALSAGTYYWRVRAVDAAGNPGPWSIVQSFEVLIGITTPSIATPVVGTPYSSALSVTGGTAPYFFSITGGTLPPGLSISTLTGEISGTPTSPGTYTFTISVTDSSSPALITSFTYTVTVPGSGGPLTIPSALNPSALPPPSLGLPYAFLFTGTGGTQPYNWSIIAGSLPTGFSLSANGLLSGTVPSAAFTGGTFVFTVQLTDSSNPANIAFGSFSITLQPTSASSGTLALNTNYPIVNGTAVLPATVTGAAFSTTIAATGGVPSYTYSITSGSLPPGLTLNSLTGQISGIATTSGTYVAVVTVTDSTGATSSIPISITVAPNGGALPAIIPPSAGIPQAVPGSPYSFTLVTAGGTAPYTWSVISGDLPPGLNLNSLTGEISGTPTLPGAYTFTVQAVDANGNVTVKTITIITISTTTVPGVTQFPAGSGGDRNRDCFLSTGSSGGNGNLWTGLLLLVAIISVCIRGNGRKLILRAVHTRGR